MDDLGPVEQASLLLGAQAILDVAILEDLGQRPPAVVLADDVGGDPLLRGGALEEK